MVSWRCVYGMFDHHDTVSSLFSGSEMDKDAGCGSAAAERPPTAKKRRTGAHLLHSIELLLVCIYVQ